MTLFLSVRAPQELQTEVDVYQRNHAKARAALSEVYTESEAELKTMAADFATQVGRPGIRRNWGVGEERGFILLFVLGILACAFSDWLLLFFFVVGPTDYRCRGHGQAAGGGPQGGERRGEARGQRLQRGLPGARQARRGRRSQSRTHRPSVMLFLFFLFIYLRV